MVICQCRRVSDAAVVATIASGATTAFDVTQACRAGGGCGSCVSTIEKLLAELAGAPRARVSIAA